MIFPREDRFFGPVRPRAYGQRLDVAHRYRRGVLLAATVWLHVATASTQPRVRVRADDEARRLFDEGVALIEDGRPADAIVRLAEARRLHEVPAVVYNLAIAQRALGQYVEGVASLDRYLRLAGARIEAPRRAEIEALLTELRSGIAQVTVHVATPGAVADIDGVPVVPERLDRPVELDPGRHVFRAGGPGLRADSVIRDVPRGGRERVALAPESMFRLGTLHIAPLVTGAAIYIDGRRAGTDAVEESAAPGTHTVEVQADGYVSYTGTVLLAGGHTEHLRPALNRRGSLLTRWWFWTGIGVATAVLVTALVVGLSSTEAPTGGSLGLVVQAAAGR